MAKSDPNEWTTLNAMHRVREAVAPSPSYYRPTQPTLTSERARVLIALLLFANASGECFPGERRLAAVAGMHRDRLRAVLRELEVDAGPLQLVIERGRVSKRGDRGETHRYFLGYAGAERVGTVSRGVGTDGPQGVGTAKGHKRIGRKSEEEIKEDMGHDANARGDHTDAPVHVHGHARSHSYVESTTPTVVPTKQTPYPLPPAPTNFSATLMTLDEWLASEPGGPVHHPTKQRPVGADRQPANQDSNTPPKTIEVSEGGGSCSHAPNPERAEWLARHPETTSEVRAHRRPRSEPEAYIPPRPTPPNQSASRRRIEPA
jgi:hypothetical protein